MSDDQGAAYEARLTRLRDLEHRILHLQARLGHDPRAVAAGIVAPTPDDVAEVLAPGEIVVDVLDDADEPAVFVVRRAPGSAPTGPARAEITFALLDKGRLTAAADAIVQARTHEGSRADASQRMSRALDAFSQAILPDPVVKLIRNARRVFLVPHALTCRLPLLHLRLPDGTPLMTAARLAAVLPSAGLLIVMRRLHARRAERIGQAAPDLTLLAVGADAVADRRIGLVDYEIHGVAASYDPAKIRCCPSYLPTRRYRLDRDRLLTMLGRKQWIHTLHLSSHGIVLDPSRPASVALLLHGSDDTPRALTAHEIASHLRTIIDLVVITSCWSGQVSHGHEADGVTAAFLRGAWARSLLVCLWPVEDRTAALFGIILHQEWRANGGRTLGEAFVATRDRLAKMDELEARAVLNWVPFASRLTPTSPTSNLWPRWPSSTAPPAWRHRDRPLDVEAALAGARRGHDHDLSRAQAAGRRDPGLDPEAVPGDEPGPEDGRAVSLVDLASFQLVGDPDLRPWLG